MRTAAVLVALVLLGGCVPDALNASSSSGPMQSTSSRRSKDPDQPKQMCEDTSIGGESRTVCY